MTTPTLSCRATYNQQMRQAIGSKLFFLDKVPVQDLGLIVDYGCADGSLLKALSGVVSSDCILIGIDNDLAQLQAARATFVEGDGFYSSWDFVDPYLRDNSKPSALILSSVLHEVLCETSLEAFWAEVEARGFDYIVLRDMAVPAHYRHEKTPRLWQALIRNSAWGGHHLRDHEQDYGPIAWMDSCVHFLLKYPYTHDWAKEHAEDYLPHAAEELTALLAAGPYVVTSAATTSTRHFQDRVKRDLGFAPSNITTHAEIILEHERVRGSLRSEVDTGGNLRVA